MRGEDARNRGEATGNNQTAWWKDERAEQHKRKRNNSNGDYDNDNDDRANNNDNNNYIGSGGQHQNIHHVLG